MKKNIFLVALLLTVTSCTHWLGLRPDEFETEEYYKKTMILDMGIDELAEVIESYKINHPYDYDTRACPHFNLIQIKEQER